MNFRKTLRPILVIVAAILFLILVYNGMNLFFGSTMHPGVFRITIKNDTEEEISGLKIAYLGIESEVTVPNISPGHTCKLDVDATKSERSENDMWIHYSSKSGKDIRKTLVGYFEKGAGGSVDIQISSINSNGEMELKVKSIP